MILGWNPYFATNDVIRSVDILRTIFLKINLFFCHPKSMRVSSIGKTNKNGPKRDTRLGCYPP